MRRIPLILFLSIWLISPLTSARLSLDLMSFDFLLSEGFRADAEVSFVYEDLEITIPVRYGKSDNGFINYIESGVLVAVHPVTGCDLFAEASLFKTGWLWGPGVMGSQWTYTSEASLGWDGRIGMVSIRPKLTFRSSIDSSSDTDATLSRIGKFPQLRFSLLLGAVIPHQSRTEAPRKAVI